MLDTMLTDGRVEMRLESEDGRTRSATIDVGDDATRLTEPGMLFEGLGFFPWQPPAMVGSLADGGAAAEAGILEGDRITSIDGQRVNSFTDLQRIVAERPDQFVNIDVIRNERKMSLTATLGHIDNDGVRRGLLGVGLNRTEGDFWYMRQYGVFAASSTGDAAYCRFACRTDVQFPVCDPGVLDIIC